jgi:O-antigen ligase
VEAVTPVSRSSLRAALPAIVIALAGAAWASAAFSVADTLTLVVLTAPAFTALVLHRPRTGLFLIMLGLPLAPAFPAHIVSRSVNFALPGLVFGAWLLHGTRQRKDVALDPKPLLLWFGLFFAWTAFTSFFTEFPDRGLGQAGRYAIMAMMLLAFTNLWRESDYRKGLLLYGFALAPIAAFALWQIYTIGVQQIMLDRLLSPKRLSSIYGNPNTLGVIMANGLVILTAYGLSLASVKQTFRRGVLLGITGSIGVLLLAGLIVSFSRSSLVYFGVALFVLMAALPRMRWVAASGAAALGIFLIVFPIPVWVLSALRVGAGTSFRTSLWEAGVQMIQNQPLTGTGAGSGVFEYYRPAYIETAVDRILVHTTGGGAHNVFLTKGAELGWIGLLLTLGLFLLLLLRVPEGLREFRKGDWLRGAAAAGVVGLFIRAFFETGNTLGSGHIDDSMIFFLFAVILLGPVKPSPFLSRGEDDRRVLRSSRSCEATRSG